MHPPESPRPLRLGISTCPNDTFAFHGLLRRLVDTRGLEFEIELLDIQELNDRLFQGEFDIAKCSFHAALLLADRYWVLPVGSALGFGVGPLLLASRAEGQPCSPEELTLCPGEHTTASLLFRLFYPQTTRIEQTVFSQIMPRLIEGTADFGVCIHEGRFTWQAQGLSLVEDLGTRWERETEQPLPLGGLVGSKALPAEVLARATAAIGDSLSLALADPQAALPTMRRYAQEFDDDVLMKHVELYVNDWTVDLGASGVAALAQLNRHARRVGVLPPESEGVLVWPRPAR
jgi:1,4-dihydroxy-6-naphthoate synthase